MDKFSIAITKNCLTILCLFVFLTMTSAQTKLLKKAGKSNSKIYACNFPPIITCPPDFNACPGVSTAPANTGFANGIPGGPSCSQPLISFQDNIISQGPCINSIEINRVWTATDPQDPKLNTSCLQKIILKDTDAPTIHDCPKDTTVIANSNCNATVFWNSPNVSDNCGKLFLSVSHVSGDIFPIGTTKVTYSAEDPCGNMSSCSFSIHVLGSCCDLPPVLRCPPDYLGCPNDGIDPSKTGVAIVTPGSPLCNVPVYRYRDSILSSGPCPGSISLIRIWTALDPIDTTKKSSCNQFIELKDDQAPVFTCCPIDITVSPGINCQTKVNWITPQVTDKCTGVVITSNIQPGTIFNVGTTTINYLATDVCGNTAQWTFNITVSECCNVNPTMTCPLDFIACPGSSTDPTITGVPKVDPGNPGCSTPIVTYKDIIISTGPCMGATRLIRHWSAIDPNDPNLKAQCLQDIQLKDTIAPHFISGPIDVNVVVDTITCSAIANWNLPDAKDNCAVISLVSTFTPGSRFPLGTTLVNYIATDVCGNSKAYSFKVNVIGNCCNKPPKIICPPDYFACPQINCNPVISGVATAIPYSSSCGTPVITYVDVLIKNYSCINARLFKRIWRATDPNDPKLFSECTQIIDLKDSIPPVFNYCPQDITVDAKGDCEAKAWWNPATATDNCGVKQVTSNYKPGNTFPAGTTVVVYTALDYCGNLTNHSFKVTVLGTGLKIQCPNNITVDKDPNWNGAVVNWNHPTVTTCKPCNDTISGFIYMGTYLGNRYFCSLSPATWPSAKVICENVGGQLCVMNSLAENQWVANKLMGQTAFIGLHDSNIEGVFQWLDGSPLSFTNWYTGQPNNANGEQDYVELVPDGTWNDQYNTSTREFICKIPCYTITQIEGPPCGALFPCGTTKVTYVAKQGKATDTCSFYVTVNCNGSTYCPSKGLDCSNLWIQCVKLANVDNCSGPNGGYKYFSNPCIEVITGNTYNLCLTPGYAGGSYQVYWKVWIDFNGDSDFEDAGELFAYGTGTTKICGDVTIPGCTPKSTRMRVAMSYGSYPANPCCTFLYGEVEDYCINIVNNVTQGGNQSLKSTNDIYKLLCAENCLNSILDVSENTIPEDQIEKLIFKENELILFPNPVSDILSIGLKNGIIQSVKVFDLDGKQVYFSDNTVFESIHKMDTGDWSQGLYFIQVKSADGSMKNGKFEVIR
ncbi:MAG: HYR domain-containing protein [Saprospiraceae bacterium]